MLPTVQCMQILGEMFHTYEGFSTQEGPGKLQRVRIRVQVIKIQMPPHNTSPLNSDPIAALSASNPFRARYTKIGPLSSGSFGFVILYANTVTKEHVAIKFLERGESITKYVEGEILNHRILRHPHVIEFKVREAITDQWPTSCMNHVACLSPCWLKSKW